MADINSHELRSQEDLSNMMVLDEKKNGRPGELWISNLTYNTKARELERFISQAAPVKSVKIVTNGKDCYGCVVMQKQQDALKCVRLLNKTIFGGRPITLSLHEPDFQIDTIDEFKPTLKNSPDSDPLTTKFHYSSRSPLRTRGSRRESSEEDRWYAKEEMIRKMRHEQKKRELEFRLHRERRKLLFERELFERQRREIFRLDKERRKIERERLEVLQERSELERQLRKNMVAVAKSKRPKPCQSDLGVLGQKCGAKTYAPPSDLRVTKGIHDSSTRNVQKIEVMVRKYCAGNSTCSKPFVGGPPGLHREPLRNQWSCGDAWGGNPTNCQGRNFPPYGGGVANYPTYSLGYPQFEPYSHTAAGRKY